MYYTLYQTTNKINGKIYVGTHITEDFADKYLGSGTLLIKAVKKYGRDSFEKRILFIFDTIEKMFEAEAEVVDLDFVSRDDTYNIKEGGIGGGLYFQTLSLKEKKELLDLAHRARKIKFETNPGSKSEWIRKHSENKNGNRNPQYGTCWIYSELLKESKNVKVEELNEYLSKEWIKGRRIESKISPDVETCYVYSLEENRSMKIDKNRLSEFLLNGWIVGYYHNKGEKNPQFGKCWVYSLIEKRSVLIKKEQLEEHLSTGWIKGRKISF